MHQNTELKNVLNQTSKANLQRDFCYQCENFINCQNEFLLCESSNRSLTKKLFECSQDAELMSHIDTFFKEEGLEGLNLISENSF